MMVRLGMLDHELGTVATSNSGILYHAGSPEDDAILRGLVGSLRDYYSSLSDNEFVARLPRALDGAYQWAHIVDEVPSSAATRAIESTQTSAYPPDILRYGDAGKALYDDQVAALVSIDVPQDEARSDVLALWDTLVKAKSLQTIDD